MNIGGWFGYVIDERVNNIEISCKTERESEYEIDLGFMNIEHTQNNNKLATQLIITQKKSARCPFTRESVFVSK